MRYVQPSVRPTTASTRRGVSAELPPSNISAKHKAYRQQRRHSQPVQSVSNPSAPRIRNPESRIQHPSSTLANAFTPHHTPIASLTHAPAPLPRSRFSTLARACSSARYIPTAKPSLSSALSSSRARASCSAGTASRVSSSSLDEGGAEAEDEADAEGAAEGEAEGEEEGVEGGELDAEGEGEDGCPPSRRVGGGRYLAYTASSWGLAEGWIAPRLRRASR